MTSQRLQTSFHLGAADGSKTRMPLSHSKQLDKPFEFRPWGHVGCVQALHPLDPFFMSLQNKNAILSLIVPINFNYYFNTFCFLFFYFKYFS
jgi:hypothetical protein